jgi:hypothetical protein
MMAERRVMKLDKEVILEAVRSEKCPMLDEMDLKKASKPEIIKHLREACCPALDRLAGLDV